MEHFTERAGSQGEALLKVREKYGQSAKILNYRSVRIPGFMGIFTKPGVEVTGYVPREPPKKLDLEEEKRKILQAANKGDPTLQLLLKEVQALKERISPATQERDAREPHENIARIKELLEGNEFTPRFVRDMEERLRREFSLEELADFQEVQDRVLEWIGESLSIFSPPQRAQGPRVIVLVGPTGVGKTTTIAKLAAYYGIGIQGRDSLRVRIITIDNYKIGGRAQIETYGEYMSIPVSSAETAEELKKTIDLYRKDADVILVDTIGKSPQDYKKLAEVREILSGLGSDAEVHLTLSATTKPSDIQEIMSQFEPFRYGAVVVTKLDETSRAGNVVSVVAERGKPISYLTDGQKVHQDIHEASPITLLTRLEGFTVNRRRLAEKFEGKALMEAWRA